MDENYKIKYKANKKIKNLKDIKKGKVNEIITDPNGSYTGVARPKSEKPVQDADDL